MCHNDEMHIIIQDKRQLRLPGPSFTNLLTESGEKLLFSISAHDITSCLLQLTIVT